MSFLTIFESPKRRAKTHFKLCLPVVSLYHGNLDLMNTVSKILLPWLLFVLAAPSLVIEPDFRAMAFRKRQEAISDRDRSLISCIGKLESRRIRIEHHG